MPITASQLLLYAVSDRSWLNGQPLEQPVQEILAAGATCLQLREKNMDRPAMTALARRLLPLCRAAGVPLIINDDVQVCLESNADGVHLGQEDLDVAAARAALGPSKIIGVSAHNLAEAQAAEAAGADYLGSGAVFSTSTKSNVTTLSYRDLQRICAGVHLPVVAIGGITAQNAAQLAGSGIAGLAVVHALFGADDKTVATRQMRALAQQVCAPR